MDRRREVGKERCRLVSLSRTRISCFCGWATELTGDVGRCRSAIRADLLRDLRDHLGLVKNRRKSEVGRGE